MQPARTSEVMKGDLFNQPAAFVISCLWPQSDQSFDIPDRTFHSMNTTWRLSSYESMTDVKELIPEFFYLPEFLVNREGSPDHRNLDM